MPRRKGPGTRSARERPAPPAEAVAGVSGKGAAPGAAQAAPASAKASARNPLFGVGASLYPLDSETCSPDDWYARDVASDLDVLAQARCAFVRVFVSWRVLEPQVGQYAQEPLARLAALVEALRSRKMQAIVCFFADDRVSELTDVSWGKRRDPRTDGYLIQRELALVQKVVGELRADTGVLAWQLGNEAFLSGFTSAADLETWVDTLRDAIREIDPTRPVGLGADPETLFRATGSDARPALERCDFAVSHVTASYRSFAAEGPVTSGPATYLDSYLLRNAHRNRPVVLDEIGVQTLDHAAAEEAAYLRLALWSGFMNRASGGMVRRVRDMETERREPYFVDPYETLVGICDEHGTPKASASEIARFVRIAAHIDLSTHTLIAERSAIVVPSERFDPLPSLAGLFDPRACLHAYIIAKQAHLPVTVIHEADPYDEYRVLIVPSAFRLADETWERLSAFVQSGGTLLMSYGGGDAPDAVRDLFGVEFLGDGGSRQTLSCRVAQDGLLGALRSFDARFPVPNHALLSGGGATVVVTDANGSPLLTVNQAGQGRAVYAAVPLERAIAQGDAFATPEPVRHLVREVYGAVARGAGCGAPVACSVPDVEIALFQGETDDVLVLLNHGPEKVKPRIATERTVASVADVRGGLPVAVGGTWFEVSLDANGVSALRLAYA